MALVEYKKKRSFQSTPEPTGGKASGNQLVFVIQKHAASRLHYDFRLEMDGVLKSWAVPKGPSMNPADKRLAMLVEDHPYDYKDFEGIIPEGNYGAGTVIIWDEGTYEPLEEGLSKAEQNKSLLKSFNAGQIKFRMNGSKLKGEFVLVRTASRGDNSWLLIKHRDKFATDDDITEQNKSVVSGKTIDQVAGNPKSEKWESNRAAKKTARKTPAKKTSRKHPEKKDAPKTNSNSATIALPAKAKKVFVPKRH